MHLTIISPKKKEVVEVVWIEVLTPDGSFVIQKNYSPTTFLLLPHKEFTYRSKTGKQESMTLEKGGLLEITREEARLLLE